MFTMTNNTSELIDKLKTGAVSRCRERIIEAREHPKRAIATTEHCRANGGLTSKLKKIRGGLS
jgi:hypothetical protein